MSEVIFPLLGTAFVMLVVLPACALIVKGALVLVEREPFHGLGLRYQLLAGSSLLPIAWFVSAGMHQAESGTSALACLFDHETTARCFEPGLFALTMLAVMAASCLRSYRRHSAARCCAADSAVAARLDRIACAHPQLRALRGRVRVTAEPGFAIGTQGLLRPVVIVGAEFAAEVRDDVLASALGHELEHVRSRDPLRYALLEFALAVNPFGRMFLEPHAARWYGAREAHCDRAAVTRGASPLALAEAIVHAARPCAPEAAGLGARDARVLELRVTMLLAFAEQRPSPCCRHESSAMPFAIVLLALALLLPHQTSTAALDVLHTGSEHALAHFWR